MNAKSDLVPPPSREISGLRTGNNSHEGETDERHGIEVPSRAQAEAASAVEQSSGASQTEPLAGDSRSRGPDGWRGPDDFRDLRCVVVGPSGRASMVQAIPSARFRGSQG